MASFLGKQDEYHEFKREFIELPSADNHPPASWMGYLKQALLTLKAKKVVEGIMDMHNVWKELNRRYGSRDTVISPAKNRLMTTKLKGPNHDQVEALL